MKRIAAFLIALAFVLALPALALGETAKHVIEEFDISVKIPEGYRLVTPDMDPDDPLLALYGMTIEDIRAMFNSMPLYMDAVKIDGTGEITLTVQYSDLPDYRDFGQSALEALGRQMTSEFENMGIEVLSVDYSYGVSTPYVRVYFKNKYAMDCGVQYFTVYDGKSYSFTLHSYTDTLPKDEDQLMRSFMAGVVFNSIPAYIYPKSEPFDFAEEISGAAFSLPENWEHTKTTSRSSTTRYTFTSLRDTGATITFVTGDLWNDLSIVQKLFNTRGKIDNSCLTYADAANIIGVSESKVDRVSVNGIEYFHADFSSTVSQNGVSLSIPASCLFRVSNAKLYMFIYVGSKTNFAHRDFDAVLESAAYPEALSGGVAPIVYVLAAGVVIFVVIMILSSRAKKKRALEKEAEEARLRAKYQEEYRKKREEQLIRHECPNCGAAVDPLLKFCGACGENMQNSEKTE